MKKILFSLFLINLSVFGAAQTFKTSLTSQGWAGGICCRTGVNYTLTITGNADELEKLVVTAVCVDKKYFDHINASQVTTVNGHSQRTYQFSSVQDRYDSDYFPDTLNTSTKPCDENKIYLERKKFLMIESRSELPFLAYP